MSKKDYGKDSATYEVQSGVVQISLPHLGILFVRPAGDHTDKPAGESVDKCLICRANNVGGNWGASSITFPPPGTMVSYRREQGSDLGYIVACNQQGTQMPSCIATQRLHTQNGDISLHQSQSVKTQLQELQKYQNKGKVGAATGAAVQDMQAGDAAILDHSGVGIFVGKLQLTQRASALSYREYSALKDKITDVATQYELDTLSDKKVSSDLFNRQLKAASPLQGLGITDPTKKALEVKQGDQLRGVNVQFAQGAGQPVYRNQKFQGGGVRGTWKTLMSPIQDGKTGRFTGDEPVLASQLQTYSGDKFSFSVGGGTSIKTAKVTGLKELPSSFYQQAKQAFKQTDQNIPVVQLDSQGLHRILQLDSVMEQEDARTIIKGMLGSELQTLVGNSVYPYGDPYSDFVQWETSQDNSQQELAQAPSTRVKDPLTWENRTFFNNTSIITQDPDGTITLKDGWGSQITMSRGNIYISSALDTFIRPGRDLVMMPGRHTSISSVGQTEISGKQDIKIGSQQNLQLASAIAGGTGHTTLENRSLSADVSTGVVIRSNANMSITASQDMHIGLNDKRKVNAGQKPTVGTGSIFIEGGDIRVQASKELNLTGGQTGIYSLSTSAGTGIQMTSSTVTIVTPQLDVDTGNFRVGNFQNTYKVPVGITGQKYVNLSKGSGTLVMSVKGSIKTKNITCAGTLLASGQLGASHFIVLDTQGQQKLSGINPQSLNSFRTSIRNLFGTSFKTSQVTLTHGSKLQKWYNDKFICDKQLLFSIPWNIKEVPAMCWQLGNKAQGKLLQPVVAIATGEKEENGTYSFPGKDAWQKDCVFITVDDNYIINKDQLFANKYVTNNKD